MSLIIASGLDGLRLLLGRHNLIAADFVIAKNAVVDCLRWSAALGWAAPWLPSVEPLDGSGAVLDDCSGASMTGTLPLAWPGAFM